MTERTNIPQRSPHSRLSGLLLTIVHLAWGVVVLWGTIVLLINVALWTKLVHTLASSSPDTVVVDYRSAWSLWPLPVHVEGLYIRGRDDNVEWMLQIEHADADIDLTYLPHKFFHCRSVRAHGGSFRLRQRLDKSANDPIFLAALPPIDGLPMPPRKPDQPSPPSTPEELANNWRIGLEDVDLQHLAEVWVDDVRVDGDGSTSGAFFIKPSVALSVGPVQIDVSNAEIHAGDYTVVDSLSGTTTATLAPMESALVPGANILNYLSAEVHLKGKIPNVAVFDYYARGNPFHVEGGAGTMAADMRVEKGVVMPASKLALDVAGVQFTMSPFVATFAMHAVIEPDPVGKFLHMRAHADDMMLQSDKGVVWARTPELALDLQTGSAELEHVANAPSLAVDVPEIDVPHMETLGAVIQNKDITINGGNAKGNLHFEFEPKDAKGRGAIAMRGPVELTYKGSNVKAGLGVDVKVSGFDLHEGDAIFGGSRVEIRDVKIDGDASGPWWGRTEIDKGHVNWKGEPSVQMHTRVQAANGRPVLLFLHDQQAIPGWVPKVLSLNDVTAQGNVAFGSSGVDVENLAVSGSELDMRANIHTHGAAAKSCFLFKSGPLEVGLDGRSGAMSVVLFDVDDWFNHASPCR